MDELSLAIGNDAESLFRGDSTLLLLIDDDVLSYFMGDVTSYFFGRHPTITHGFRAGGIDNNVGLRRCFLFNKEALPL